MNYEEVLKAMSATGICPLCQWNIEKTPWASREHRAKVHAGYHMLAGDCQHENRKEERHGLR